MQRFFTRFSRGGCSVRASVRAEETHIRTALFALPASSLVGCAGSERVDTILALTGDADAGATIYADNCASCHGADGTGATERAILGTESEEIAEIVLNGEDSMPSFADSLEDQDIADIIAWIEAQG